MEQHAHAPVWDYTCGDRLVEADLPVLDAMCAGLAHDPPAGVIPDAVLDRLLAQRERVPHLRRHLPDTRDEIVRQWATLPTLSRDDLVHSTPAFVLDDADLDRMVIYATSGTTGHPILIPTPPIGAAAYHLLLDRALGLWGVEIP